MPVSTATGTDPPLPSSLSSQLSGDYSAIKQNEPHAMSVLAIKPVASTSAEAKDDNIVADNLNANQRFIRKMTK